MAKESPSSVGAAWCAFGAFARQCCRGLSFVPNFKPLTPIGLDSRRVWPFIVNDPN